MQKYCSKNLILQLGTYIKKLIKFKKVKNTTTITLMIGGKIFSNSEHLITFAQS